MPTCSPTLLTKRASSDELRRTFEKVESVSSNVSSRKLVKKPTRIFHISVSRLAEIDPLTDCLDSRSSASKNMFSRVRKTQKFQGSSSGWAFVTRRAPSAPPVGLVETRNCWPSGVWAA